MGVTPDLKLVTITMASSADESAVVAIPSGYHLVGIKLPAAFDATTAKLILKVDCVEGGDTSAATCAQPKDQDGTAITESVVTVAATNTNLRVNLSADKWSEWDMLQVAAFASDGTTAVTQTATRTLYAVCMRY